MQSHVLCWFWSRAGLWLGAFVEQQLCSGARAAGRAAASGSGSNRAAFVSWGCWEPCDQSCHSHFGQTTRGDWREGGTGGERGSVWEDVEVANPPSPSPSPPLSCTWTSGTAQQAWMIDYTACTLIGPLLCHCCDSSSTWGGQRGVSVCLTFISIISCSKQPSMFTCLPRSCSTKLLLWLTYKHLYNEHSFNTPDLK